MFEPAVPGGLLPAGGPDNPDPLWLSGHPAGCSDRLSAGNMTYFA
jgi:hypothetical protein